MSQLMTVSEVARELEHELGMAIRPRTISDLFYQRQIPDELGPIVGGRRLIPREALPRICDLVRNTKGIRPGRGKHAGTNRSRG